jgi:hypothetical protein
MKYVSIVAVAVIFFACSGSDYELKQSVFIEDEEAVGLPQYSEWGYNTFGAYYAREKFISNDKEVPLNVIHEGNATLFQFNGQRGYYAASRDNSMSMTITYEGFNPETYEDLLGLNDVILDFKDGALNVVFTDAFGSYQAEILSGQMHIKRAQYLLVDKRPTQVILSGVFEMQAKIDGSPVTVSEGRFDIGVNGDNFFKY